LLTIDEWLVNKPDERFGRVLARSSWNCVAATPAPRSRPSWRAQSSRRRHGQPILESWS